MTKYEKKRFKILKKKLKKEGVKRFSSEEAEELHNYFIQDNFNLERKIKISNFICNCVLCLGLIASIFGILYATFS